MPVAQLEAEPPHLLHRMHRDAGELAGRKVYDEDALCICIEDIPLVQAALQADAHLLAGVRALAQKLLIQLVPLEEYPLHSPPLEGVGLTIAQYLFY